MFSTNHILLVVILLPLIVGQSSPAAKADDTALKADGVEPLKPSQIEFTKKWWKQLGADQRRATQADSAANLRARRRNMKATNYAIGHRPSGDMQFLDSISDTFFPIGDPYTGLPDGITDMGRYCIEFIIKGILFVAYTTARWPHKILLKTMIGLGAITFLATNFMFCLNPLAMMNVVKKGKIVNQNMAELTENTNLWKRRIANSIDGFTNMIRIQKHSCCAYFDWKMKSVQLVAPEARDFIYQWFTAFFKIHEIVYCQTFSMQQAKHMCADYEFMDTEPKRVLPRSYITLCVELFSKFF